MQEVSHMKNMFVEIITEFLTTEKFVIYEFNIGLDYTLIIHITQKDESQCYFLYIIKRNLEEIPFDTFIKELIDLKHVDSNKIDFMKQKFETILKDATGNHYNTNLLETFFKNIF